MVQRTGAAKIMDSPQTTISDLRQLVMVHRDLDFMGNTMTMNLSVVTANKFRIEATPDKTLEYSEILQGTLSVNA